jgi:hypothetical protein
MNAERITMRKALALLAAAAGGLLAAPLVAAAAPPLPVEEAHRFGFDTNNFATEPFVKTTGGVTIIYWCERTSGDISNTRVQLVNDAQTVAYRDFPAVCDGNDHNLGSLNAPSNTVMRARVHVYTGGRVNGEISALFTGRMN